MPRRVEHSLRECGPAAALAERVLHHFVSPHAKKLLALAGASWSFAGAAAHLAEFCGLRTCDRTIRAVCFEEAGLVADWLHGGPAAGAAFAAAGGDTEFQADGTKANTWQGWREMRLGVFAKRARGRPATSGDGPSCWATRGGWPWGSRSAAAWWRGRASR